MKKLAFMLVLVCCILMLASCQDTDTSKNPQLANSEKQTITVNCECDCDSYKPVLPSGMASKVYFVDSQYTLGECYFEFINESLVAFTLANDEVKYVPASSISRMDILPD